MPRDFPVERERERERERIESSAGDAGRTAPEASMDDDDKILGHLQKRAHKHASETERFSFPLLTY